eukprot:2939042-Lingulodinium_polyedra.AAC.1
MDTTSGRGPWSSGSDPWAQRASASPPMVAGSDPEFATPEAASFSGPASQAASLCTVGPSASASLAGQQVSSLAVDRPLPPTGLMSVPVTPEEARA